MTTSEPDWSDAPFVCPGCHCIGAEPHAPGCIDGELEEELRNEQLYGRHDEIAEGDP